MTEQARETVKIELLGKTYKMTCAPDDVEELKKTREILNERLIELGGAKVVTEGKIELIIVAAALNLANDLMDKEGRLAHLEYQLAEMVKRVDAFDSRLKEATSTPDW